MKNLLMIWLVFCCCIAGHVKAQTDSTGCGVQLSIAQSTDSSGITTFTAIYSGTTETNPFIEWWTSTGDYVVATSYSTHIPPAGMEVCVNLGIYQPSEYSDSCYTSYCAYFEGDTLSQSNCNAQASFSRVSSPTGETTFTAEYTGLNNPVIHWYRNGDFIGNANSMTIPAENGDQICVRVVSSVYDSTQQTIDSCYAAYCEVFYADSVPTDGCNAQISLTHTTDAWGATTFYAVYSGVQYPSFQWFVNGSYVSNSPYNYTISLPDSALICVRVGGYNLTYDSLQQTPGIETCYAEYCEFFVAIPQNNCNANVWFSYDPNATASTPTTFTANYSGVNNPNFQWYVNGVAVGTSSPTYTGIVADGIPVCVRLTGYNAVYDSVSQETIYIDSSCYAQYCQTFQQDSIIGNNCNAEVSFTYAAEPNGMTTFHAVHSGAGNVLFSWSINWSTVGYGSDYTGYVMPGTQVRLFLQGSNTYYDSVLQMEHYDSCYTMYSETIYADTMLSGCNASVSYTSATDSTGFTTFAAQYSGANNPDFIWYVNGYYSGSGASHTLNINSGSEVCVVLFDYSETDSCLALFCETFYPDTLQENYSAAFSYTYDPVTGQTTFTAEDAQKQQTEFTWLVNGVLMSNDPQFTAVVPEGVEVCLLVQSSAQSTAVGGISCQFVSQETASLDENEQVVYKLYPNPASDRISISVSAEGKADLISITDLYGRQVLTSTTWNNIDVSQLSRGVYYVRVLDSAGNSLWNESLIKQ